MVLQRVRYSDHERYWHCPKDREVLRQIYPGARRLDLNYKRNGWHQLSVLAGDSRKERTTKIDTYIISHSRRPAYERDLRQEVFRKPFGIPPGSEAF